MPRHRLLTPVVVALVVGASSCSNASDGRVTSPDQAVAETFTFDSRILSLHVGGGAVWAVRRGPDRTGNRLERFVDGVASGPVDLPDGIVADAAGDDRGLWVATGGPEAVHLDVTTGRVDARVAVDDAEWIGLTDATVVVAGPATAGDGTAVTVADAVSGEVQWQASVPAVDWTAVVGVAWMDDLAWLGHFELPEEPTEVRGGLVGVDATGRVVVSHDAELRWLAAVGDRLVGLSELLSSRESPAPTAHLVGPGRDEVASTRVGRANDLAVTATVDDGRAWVLVEVAGDGPRVVEVTTDAATPRAVRLPVSRTELVEWVAADGDDLWFVTAGGEFDDDGDLPTTLWRLPGALAG